MEKKSTQTKAGLSYIKDKRARIYRPEIITDDDGVEHVYYSIIYPDPIRCYAAQQKQTMENYKSFRDGKEERFFVFNNHVKNKARVKDIIRYRDKDFEIFRIDTLDDYKGEVFVYASEIRHVELARDRHSEMEKNR